MMLYHTSSDFEAIQCIFNFKLFVFHLFWLRFAAGLSHQPADSPRVQPLHHRHGQLPVELQNVSYQQPWREDWRRTAAQEQSATVGGTLQLHLSPCLHELCHRLSPEGGWPSFVLYTHTFLNKSPTFASYSTEREQWGVCLQWSLVINQGDKCDINVSFIDDTLIQ